jgi:uncharacterized glyoxalase superfamily protein PhnB
VAPGGPFPGVSNYQQLAGMIHAGNTTPFSSGVCRSRAADAGATVLMPAEDMFWGDRYGVVTDPFGHKWSFATHVKDLTPAEVQAAMEEAFAQGS